MRWFYSISYWCFFLYPSWNDQKVSPLFAEPVNMNNDWVMKDSFFAAILPGCFGILVLWAWFCFSLQLPCWCKQITVQISKRTLYTIVGRSYNKFFKNLMYSWPIRVKFSDSTNSWGGLSLGSKLVEHFFLTWQQIWKAFFKDVP